MPKSRVQINLSEAAHAELIRRAGGKDKRQAFIESWLTDSQAPERTDDNASSLNNPATAEKKAARVKRKETLNDSIKEALPPREPLDIIREDTRTAIDLAKSRPRFGGSFPKPGKAK